jgi:gas vesicle protein
MDQVIDYLLTQGALGVFVAFVIVLLFYGIRHKETREKEHRKEISDAYREHKEEMRIIHFEHKKEVKEIIDNFVNVINKHSDTIKDFIKSEAIQTEKMNQIINDLNKNN